MWLQLILIATIALVGLLFFRSGRDRSKPAPPGLGLSPVLPDVVSFFKDPISAIKKSEERGDKVFSIGLGLTKRWHFIHDRSIFKPYFATGEDTLSLEASIGVFFSHLFEGGAFGDDPEWPNQYRKVITSGLWKVSQLDVFETAIGNSVNKYLEKNLSKYASSGEWFDITPELHKCVALTNLRIFLGEDAVHTHGDVWQHLFPELDKLSVDQLVSSAPWLPFGKPKRFQEVKSQVFKLMGDAWQIVVEDTIEKYERDGKSILFDSYGELLAHGWENRISARTVTAHMLGMLFAAHVNTASSLLWATALIAKRPEYVDKILQEVNCGQPSKSTSGEDSSQSITAGIFTFAALREVARIYPILGTMRIAMEDIQIPGTSFWAKKGDMISATPFRSHFDQSYFPDPQSFKPERFNDDEANKSAMGSQAYIGFGSGGHTCLGERFVLRIGRKWLQGLFSRYEVEVKNDTLPAPVWSTISNPAPSAPIMIRLKNRVM